jgi:hypothetical protein
MALSEVCNTGLALALASHHEKPAENHLLQPDPQEEKKRERRRRRSSP